MSRLLKHHYLMVVDRWSKHDVCDVEKVMISGDLVGVWMVSDGNKIGL